MKSHITPRFRKALEIGSHAEYDRLLSQSRFTLAEDAEDLAAYRERAKEPDLDFESALKNLPH